MKRLASTLPNMVLSLTLITAVAGALLGVVYEVTKEPIARQEREQQLNAIRAVAPPFDNNPEADSKVVTLGGVDYTVYPAIKDGRLVGAAVKTLSMNGFSGEIDVMVGFDAEGKVLDYSVIKHAETPGLGSRMQEWFRDPTGFRSIIDKNPGATSFYVVKDTGNKGEIDGITAATISSRAFLESVRNAYTAWRAYQGHDVQSDGATGASTQTGAASTDASSGASIREGHEANSHDASTGASAQEGHEEHDASTGASVREEEHDASTGASAQEHHKHRKSKRKVKDKDDD